MTKLSDPIVRRLLRARDRVHDEPDAPLTLDSLARTAQLSPHHFLRCFSKAFGVTPHDYLRAVRLQRAKILLASGTSVTEACIAVGFSSLGSFSALFARETGASPRQWQLAVRRVIQSPASLQYLWIPTCFASRISSSNFGEAT